MMIAVSLKKTFKDAFGMSFRKIIYSLQIGTLTEEGWKE